MSEIITADNVETKKATNFLCCFNWNYMSHHRSSVWKFNSVLLSEIIWSFIGWNQMRRFGDSSLGAPTNGINVLIRDSTQFRIGQQGRAHISSWRGVQRRVIGRSCGTACRMLCQLASQSGVKSQVSHAGGGGLEVLHFSWNLISKRTLKVI